MVQSREALAGQGETGRVILRLLAPGDESEFLGLSRARIDEPFMALPTTSDAFQAYLRRYQQPDAESRLVCLRDGGDIAGLVNISNIVRGRFQCGSLSYAAFPPAAGKGYMTEGLALFVRHAFGQLRLHRLEANIQPGNQRSLRLVQRLGFRREGYSPEMLFIDGAWRDHERWAITATMTDIAAEPHPSLPSR